MNYLYLLSAFYETSYLKCLQKYSILGNFHTNISESTTSIRQFVLSGESKNLSIQFLLLYFKIWKLTNNTENGTIFIVMN